MAEQNLHKHKTSFYFQQSEANLADDLKEQIECRICLQGESIGNQLIAPCNCTGSVEYIHFNCMKEWIIRNRRAGKKVMKCEMCQQVIVYEISKNRKTANWEQFKYNVSKDQKYFAFIVVMIVLCLGLFIYLAILLVTSMEGKQKIGWLELALLSFALVLLLMFIIIFTINIIKNFAMINSADISKIQSKKKNSKKPELTTNPSNTTLGNMNEYCGNRAKVHPILISQIQ